MRKKGKRREVVQPKRSLSAEEVMLIANRIQQELEAYADVVKRERLYHFFKTGKGQYGEGDRFLGVTVPNIRLVVCQHKHEPLEAIAMLLLSEWHECRLCALLMMVDRFKRGNEEERKDIYNLYLSQTAHINNWDLVDLSAPKIVGEYLKNRTHEELYRLADSNLLWNNRIAVVATYTFISNNDYIDIICLAEHFITQTDAHLHDLMQKAIGWMLREMGKRNKELLVQFLEKHAVRMPRTMLRYAIEKFPEEERKEFMKRK